MQPAGILEAALYADDLEAAEAFYTGVLGLDVLAKAEGRHVFFRCGDGVVLVFNPEATARPPAPNARLPVPPHGSHGPGHLCFRADGDEIEHWKRYVSERGVAVEADFFWPNGGRSLYIRDPAGNSLEFAERKIWNL